jgi:cation:H+ antiporter
MEILLWSVVFVVSLGLLVKGAGWFLDSAEKMGHAIGLSPFVIGVVLVGFGTSLPELMSSLFAVWQGVPEVVAANVIGSNIANILLIVGFSALAGGRLAVSKSLIDLDIPILVTSTTLGAIIMWDGSITRPEAALLFAGFLVFLAYSVRNGGTAAEVRQLFSFAPHRAIEIEGFTDTAEDRARVRRADVVWLVIGLVGLLLGAKYLIDSVIALSTLFAIGVGAISLFAVAVGTSLPELAVSVKAAWDNKHDVALGNIFGSNAFNLLFIIGLPGMFTALPIDAPTMALGLPTMLIATFFLVISGISQRVHSYEGAFYLIVYIFFVGRLFGVL